MKFAPCFLASLFAFSCAAASSGQVSMRMHFIDVGQGDATLLEFPCAAVLVDTGGENNGMFNSTVELEAYLEDFFDRRQDLNRHLTALILSHPHIDHTRGVRLIRDNYAPENVVTNGQTGSSGGAQQRMIQRYAAENEDGPNAVGFRAVRLDDIPTNGLTGPVIDPVDCDCPDGGGVDPVLTVFWGQVTTDPGWSDAEFGNANNHSIVLRVDFGNASLVLTGDLEETGIETMLHRYQGTDHLDVDVYQVGHHGSFNGTTPDLVQVMSPEYAVVSMGPVDREVMWTAWAYGHPRREVIDLLQSYIQTTRPPIDVQVGRRGRSFEDRTINQAVYATGWDGTIVFEAGTDGVFRVIAPTGTPDLINVNTASAEQLDALPRIGPVKAEAIIDYRDANGPFATIGDLLNVHGIGPATLEAIRPHVTLGS